jgi:hypothetical protein
MNEGGGEVADEEEHSGRDFYAPVSSFNESDADEERVISPGGNDTANQDTLADTADGLSSHLKGLTKESIVNGNNSPKIMPSQLHIPLDTEMYESDISAARYVTDFSQSEESSQ